MEKQKHLQAQRRLHNMSVAESLAEEHQQKLLRRHEVTRSYVVAVTDMFTTHSLPTYTARHNAALRIQCAWRRAKARLLVFHRRQVLFHFVHHFQRAAALSALQCFRTFVEQRRARRALAAERETFRLMAASELRQHESALTITRHLRSYIKRRKARERLMLALRIEQEAKLRLYEAAAIIVQRWWPLAKTARAYWRRRNADIAEETRIVEERNRRDQAATRIQKWVRGRQTRRWVVGYRERRREERMRKRRQIHEATDVLRILLREYRARCVRTHLESEKGFQRRNTAASKIQEGWSEALSRRKMKEVKARGRAVQVAARRIQRCFRSHRARRDRRVLAVIRRSTAEIRIEKEAKRERAARRLQCAYRCHLARRKVRRVKASLGRRILQATWLVQRCGRASVARVQAGGDRALHLALMANAAGGGPPAPARLLHPERMPCMWQRANAARPIRGGMR